METLAVLVAKYLFVLALLLTLYYWIRTNSLEKQGLEIFALFSLPVTYLVGLLARTFYYNPRPFVIEGFAPLIAHAPDNGFPSDHTLLLAALATLLSFFDKKWAIPVWVITLLVGTSRVYLGLHHALDILGSIVIALVVGALVHFVLEKRKKV